MGSGAFIADDFTRTCYASNIEFVNSNNQFYVPNNVPIEVTADIPNTYKAAYLGDLILDIPKDKALEAPLKGIEVEGTDLRYGSNCAGIHSSHGVDGNDTELRSQEKDGALEEQLASLNKPPIKSFMKNGDIIDCIDIYKQLAFDHPLLKNHKLQMGPSSLPKPAEPVSRKKTRSTVGLRDGIELCPNGTVPFRRIQKDELLKGNALLNQKHHRPVSPNLVMPAGRHFAVVTTPVDNLFLQFFGGKTSISVYNLTVEAQQITAASFWIGTGVHGPFNSIEYGWTINPGLYGDHEPRTFSLWTADGLQKTGCYNALCPGFVQVSRKMIMGQVAHPDLRTGNWWLVQDLSTGKNEPVGYWPQELFPSMKFGARVVQTGGKVYSPYNLHNLTPMGSGSFVAGDFFRTCYASNIKFVNSDYQFQVPETVSMQVAADDTYKADYLGDASKHHHPERGPLDHCNAHFCPWVEYWNQSALYESGGGAAEVVLWFGGVGPCVLGADEGLVGSMVVAEGLMGGGIGVAGEVMVEAMGGGEVDEWRR
ncbi:hypothetical protein KSS87_008380 [Heliosperma pusillum]|nr:hypothetical protein KSS87_008380 [Heliosperma pusillum]